MNISQHLNSLLSIAVLICAVSGVLQWQRALRAEGRVEVLVEQVEQHTRTEQRLEESLAAARARAAQVDTLRMVLIDTLQVRQDSIVTRLLEVVPDSVQTYIHQLVSEHEAEVFEWKQRVRARDRIIAQQDSLLLVKDELNASLRAAFEAQQEVTPGLFGKTFERVAWFGGGLLVGLVVAGGGR